MLSGRRNRAIRWVDWRSPKLLFAIRFTKQQNFDSPPWRGLVEVYAALGVAINTPEVTYVRHLRHLLAHQRGELRTKEKREQFEAELNQLDEHRMHFGEVRDVPLKRERIVEMMDTLATKVRETDPAPWAYVFGRDEFPMALLKLTEGKQPILEFVKT